FGEPHVRPGPAAVSRLPDAVPIRDVAADVVLAGADIDDVGVRLAHPDGPDGPAEVLVGDRLPAMTAIGRLEDAAAGGAHPVFVGPRVGARYRDGAAASIRANVAPLERVEERRVIGSIRTLRRGRGRARGGWG